MSETSATNTRIPAACDEVAEAMCVVLRARDLAPELVAELDAIDDHLGAIRGALEALCVAPPTTESTLGSLYSWTSRPDDPEWESKLIAVMTIQIHARAARSYLFGPDPGDDTDDAFDEPPPTLDAPDELRRELEAIDAAITAARQRLRGLPH